MGLDTSARSVSKPSCWAIRIVSDSFRQFHFVDWPAASAAGGNHEEPPCVDSVCGMRRAGKRAGSGRATADAGRPGDPTLDAGGAA